MKGPQSLQTNRGGWNRMEETRVHAISLEEDGRAGGMSFRLAALHLVTRTDRRTSKQANSQSIIRRCFSSSLPPSIPSCHSSACDSRRNFAEVETPSMPPARLLRTSYYKSFLTTTTTITTITTATTTMNTPVSITIPIYFTS